MRSRVTYTYAKTLKLLDGNRQDFQFKLVCYLEVVHLNIYITVNICKIMKNYTCVTKEKCLSKEV